MIRLLYLLPLLAVPWVWPWVRDGTWCDRDVVVPSRYRCVICGGPDPDGVGECGRCFVEEDTRARRRADA